ncbi:histidine kinase [Streptomyces sioyaensis]|uniref:sensor histidine kinase n=1 Tax=Streptomyces sioyaensis TaxID=67364 RepID=UPI0033EE93BF
MSALTALFDASGQVWGASGGCVWAVVAAVVLPLRRWVPWAALPAAGCLVGLNGGLVAAVVTAFGAARRISSGRHGSSPLPLAGLVPLAVGVGVVLTAGRLLWLGWGASPLALSVPSTALFLVPPALIGALVGQRQRLVRVLRERNRYLEQSERLADARARLQERSRIAEEMHDNLGHLLTLIALYAGGLQLAATTKAPEMSEEAALVQSTARTALEELREILGVLRSEAEQDASGEGDGTRQGISRLLAASRRAGLKVDLSWRAAGGLAAVQPAARRAAHRVIREALTNVHKHATAATVEVVVEETGQALRVTVSNSAEKDGATAERLRGTGSGLVGLEERIALLGGRFHAGPSADGGFTVRADIPLQAPTTGAAAAYRRNAKATIGQAALDDRPTTASPLLSQASSEHDLAREQERTIVRSGRNIAVGCLISGVVFAGLALAAGFWALSELPHAGIHQQDFESVTVGMSRDEVERHVGRGADGIVRKSVQRQEPPAPRGSDCTYGIALLDNASAGQDRAYRFCFTGNRLVEKTAFTLRKR